MFCLAHLACTQGTAQTVARAIWEETEPPKATGPFGRAMQELRKLGRCTARGWWHETPPGTKTTVHVVYADKGYVEHLFRESIGEHQLGTPDRRRPRSFGGMVARLDRDLTLLKLNLCATELDKSMLRGVLAAALWTADRVYRRGLRPDDRCPYYDQGVPEDEDHLLWWCEAWKSARAPFMAEVMLLAKAIKLGAPSYYNYYNCADLHRSPWSSAADWPEG